MKVFAPCVHGTMYADEQGVGHTPTEIAPMTDFLSRAKPAGIRANMQR